MAELVSDRPIWRGDFLSLSEMTWQVDQGDEVTRVVVHHPGAVVVVPVTTSGRVIAVKQFRASVGGDLLELCAGKRDVQGEVPIETAKRELEEELGLFADHWVQIARFRNSPGFCDEVSYLFLAMGLTAGSRAPQSIEERNSSLVSFKLEDSLSMVTSGVIDDAKTIIGLLQTQAYLQNVPMPSIVVDQSGLIETIGAASV